MNQVDATLKNKILRTIIWLVLFPFLAFWPFLSAFPIFSLINGDHYDITTSLNILFFLSGFWPLMALSLAALALMYDDARNDAYRILSGNGLWVGIYSILWTGLYLIAFFATR